ncbi:MAG: YfhO family protein, partial [Acidimicrobiales bacterium]
TADVDATRQAVVLLKSTFDPGWTVTVDGHAATTVMLAPAFVGVEVTPGRHVVTFAFRGFRYYPLLYAISALTIAAVVIGEERLRRWARRLRRRGPAESSA